MHTMSDSERAARATVKALHTSIRAELREAHAAGGQRHRYAILAWAWARQMPYRRFERSHRVQVLGDDEAFEHNRPEAFTLASALAPFYPEIAADLVARNFTRGTPSRTLIEAWLADPSGAVPAPAPRTKRPFERRALPVAR